MKGLFAIRFNLKVLSLVGILLTPTLNWGQDADPPCLQSGEKRVDVGGFTLWLRSMGGPCPPTIVLDAGLADA